MADAKYRAIFNKVDRNGDGSLDLKEFEGLLAVSIGKVPDADLVKKIQEQVDTNKDGKVSFDEYFAFVTKPANQIGDLLKAFDANGDGFLSLAELSALMKFWGKEKSDAELKKMLDDCDSNKDGKVSLSEFIAKYKI